MMRWPRRGSHFSSEPSGSGRRGRRAARLALYSVPLIAVAAIVLGTTGTLSQFVASITNSNNHVVSGSIGLTETHPPNEPCVAPPSQNGTWTECDNINKYGGANLSPQTPSVEQPVTLENTGTVTGRLFLLPSACTDSLEGAGGGLCNLVNVTVACTNSGMVGPTTLNDFFVNRGQGVTPPPPPSGTPPTAGYFMGTIDPGNSIDCTFTLTLVPGANIPEAGGDISQPLAWRLTAP